MDDRKRKHAHQGDKPKAKRQTRSMAHFAGMGSVTKDRNTPKAAQSNRKRKVVLKRAKSEGYDSTRNEYESSSEVYVSASDSGEEYDPQDNDEQSRLSRVPSEKREKREQSWGMEGSSDRSDYDSDIHRIKYSTRDDAKSDTITQHVTPSRKSQSKVGDTSRFQAFVRVMNSTWKPPSTYTELANIRNRATFSLRHHMLLQEGYLRQSDLVNCFADIQPVPSSGATQQVVGLGLSMQYGHKVPTAKTEIAMVLRHKDYRRCPVGSLALYLFSRFHTQCEELPDFTDPEVWPKNKLLRSSTSTQAVQRELQSNLCTKLSKDLGIDTNTIQQIGRLSGVEELQALGLNLSFPARIAPNGVDMLGIMAMAGFHDADYETKRDHVIPPKSLQRRIFPGIEEQYGWMEPEEWRAHCDRVMMSPTAFLGFGGASGTEMKRRLDAVQESEEAYQDVAKLQLMHLLLWLRRVVLQDAVLFKRDRFSDWVIKDPVFHSAEFNKFQVELLAKIGPDDGANPVDVIEQEDPSVPDIPSLGTNSELTNNDNNDELSIHDNISDLSDPNSASSSADSGDARSETPDAETIMQQHSHLNQVQLQIQQLQERLEQQEQLRQQQEQCLQEQTALLLNVLEQQSSLESQMRVIQTQIQDQVQTMQTELMARQDSQFSTLVVLLQGIIAARSPPSNSPAVFHSAGTPPVSKAVNDLAVSSVPAPNQGSSATRGAALESLMPPSPS